MKTKSNKNQTSELKSRPEQLSTNTQTTDQAKPARILPYVNFQQRDENRALATDRVLDLLRKWMPEQYGLAEVVGKWVWIGFSDKQPPEVTRVLSQLSSTTIIPFQRRQL